MAKGASNEGVATRPNPATAMALAHVGPRLKALRHLRHLTLGEVSLATGISTSTLSRLEHGERRPTLELLLSLSQLYAVPLDHLVGAPAQQDMAAKQWAMGDAFSIADCAACPALFYADKVARVTSVHETVDGESHIGVVIEDDPAAELHEWYGRYLYFAPDEVEPLETQDLSPERSSRWQ